MKLLLLAMSIIFLVSQKAKAQNEALINEYTLNRYLDAGVALSKNNQAGTLACYYSWNLRKTKKTLKNFHVGAGIRFTSFSGTDVFFQSAPPSLYEVAGSADTLFAKSSQIYALNTSINFGYNFSDKLQLGFDIDVIGISFGPQENPVFSAAGKQKPVSASPTTLNVLLVAANDKGTINSDLYLRYKVSSKIALSATYHNLFTELTTKETSQTIPEINNRFRHVVNAFGFDISYFF